MRLKKILFLLLGFTFQITILTAQDPVPKSSSDIRIDLQKLNTIGTVLYVAAHPDDENTRLLSYMARELSLRTVYLSLTRGDGGQNLIGKEQGSELGMIRTQELLAARRIDGAEQLFTRANDFGYSKNPEETFSIWKEEEILADVVWAIRLTKPDVIINRFPTTGEGGHGHHTASAMLAVKAFRDAANPNRFPEQLKYVDVWQTKRIFHNSFTPRGQTPTVVPGQITMDVGTYNPLTGESYGEIAANSRSMHKSQGFGVARARGPIKENFRKLDGDTNVTGIFENIDLSWNRIEGGSKIGVMINQIMKDFNDFHPEKSVQPLTVVLQEIRKLKNGHWKTIKEKEVTELILACSGMWIEANTDVFQATPGDSVQLTLTTISRLSDQIKINSISIPGKEIAPSKTALKNEPITIVEKIYIPGDTPVSQPYWLTKPHGISSFNVADQQLIGKPWTDPAFTVTFDMNVYGVTIKSQRPVNYKYTDPVKGEKYRNFDIVPSISIIPIENNLLVTNSDPQKFKVQVNLSGKSFNGKLVCKAPDGYTITPNEIPVQLSSLNATITSEFTLIPDNSKFKSESAKIISVEANEAGKTYRHTVNKIDYDHIPPLFSLEESNIKVVSFDLKTSVKKIGYIEGPGDAVAASLKMAGLDVVILDDEQLLTGNLNEFGAIITGIRVYNTNEKMDGYYERLMNYVEQGGTLIVQYNTNNFISKVGEKIGPYTFKVGRERVTDEKATVTFLKPEHKLLNTPNAITKNDFDNWVQERGLYFASEPAPEYETILTWNDPGEKPLDSGLIIAPKGKGHFIYTGISFFRQLPAGVPGAFRLMFNLINASK
ncbi:MAG: PIG-L family deacetylase [Bacteroidetes bacterium]|nr:PIG-L family deacetylase [Bacteroidota bacterium]